MRCSLLTGTVPLRCSLFAGNVPVRCFLVTGTVPADKLFLILLICVRRGGCSLTHSARTPFPQSKWMKERRRRTIMPSLVATTYVSARTTFVRTHFVRTNWSFKGMELTIQTPSWVLLWDSWTSFYYLKKQIVSGVLWPSKYMLWFPGNCYMKRGWKE